MRHGRSLVLPSLVVWLAVACGEEEQTASLSCGAAQLLARGDLAGAAVEEEAEVAGQNLDNACTAAECFLDAYFIGGGRLRLEWPAPITLGVEAAASGYLNLFAHGGTNVGNSGTDGFPSLVTLQANGMTFVLRSLHEAPYSSGSAVAGELAGCVTFK